MIQGTNIGGYLAAKHAFEENLQRMSSAIKV